MICVWTNATGAGALEPLGVYWAIKLGWFGGWIPAERMSLTSVSTKYLPFNLC